MSKISYVHPSVTFAIVHNLAPNDGVTISLFSTQLSRCIFLLLYQNKLFAIECDATTVDYQLYSMSHRHRRIRFVTKNCFPCCFFFGSQFSLRIYRIDSLFVDDRCHWNRPKVRVCFIETLIRSAFFAFSMNNFSNQLSSFLFTVTDLVPSPHHFVIRLYTNDYDY